MNEQAWLIEMAHNDAPIPRWWNPAPNKGWVWDASEAIRFCREQDARDYLAGQRSLQGKPTEHVFLAYSPLPALADEEMRHDGPL